MDTYEMLFEVLKEALLKFFHIPLRVRMIVDGIAVNGFNGEHEYSMIIEKLNTEGIEYKVHIVQCKPNCKFIEIRIFLQDDFRFLNKRLIYLRGVTLDDVVSVLERIEPKNSFEKLLKSVYFDKLCSVIIE